jgi:hypothetical protein
LSNFCKRVEHIVNSSIMKHLDIHKILTDSQHGFRALQCVAANAIVV